MDAAPSDVVWAVVAALAMVMGPVSVVKGLLDLPDDASAMRIAWTTLTLGFWAVLGARWIGLGAWRRTVWGCRLVEVPCPRHGDRCVAADPASEASSGRRRD